MGSRRRAFLVLYTLSGAAGLVYEVSWTRLLTLQLGHTVAAASTVLAAFMGGLAIGAWAAGRLTPRDPTSNLRLYAALEIAVALAALLLPLALGASVPALAAAYNDGASPARFALVRVAISLVLVGVPAAAMGATFPIVAGAAARTPPDAGALYAANTTGAAVGAIAAGFWLVPALGLRGTTWIGVALNIVAAAGAFWLAGTLNAEPGELAEVSPKRSAKAFALHRTAETSARTKRSTKEREGLSRASQAKPIKREGFSRAGLACAAAAISGFSALIYEVAWTRLLALVIGPTTYAFATMAASFITGLAIGSALGTRLARRLTNPTVWLALMLVAGAAAATLSAWYAATQMPLVVAVEVADPSVDFQAVVWKQAFLVGLLLLPMTVALGASFPLALEVAGGGPTSATQTVASSAARVYTANTLGAIAGALAAGFLIVPALGIRDAIRLAALASVAGGVVCLVASGATAAGRSTTSGRGPSTGSGRGAWRRTGLVPGVAALAALVAIAFAPPWDAVLLSSGAYKYAPYLRGADLSAVLRAGSLQYYKEGAAATVSVRDLTGTRSLAIDGKVDASNAGDMLTQRLLGLLPVLIHGHAEDVAIIGLGSGVTAGSALAAGTVRRTDVVEISPEVVEASHYFDRENGRALAQPGVRLIVGDGRSHLLLTRRSYDVIVSEPSNPWMAGVASLFTREFFEAARSRLKPNGLLCQWAHTYDIRPEDLRSIVRTFASVFPEATMWLVGGGDLLLIGARDGAIAPRLTAVEAGGRSDAVARMLADVGIASGTAPFALLSLFVGGPSELARFGSGADVQTDDRTALEYSAPRGIYGRSREDNVASILELHPERPPAVRDTFAHADARAWTSRGAMDLRAQAFTSAYGAFMHAVTLDSRDADALSGLSDAAGGANKLTEERDWLQTTAAREPGNAVVRIELSRILSVMGDANSAIEAAQQALQLTPDSSRAAEQLASVLADAGDAQRLASFSAAMVARFPNSPEAEYYRATALFMAGKTEEAVAAVRRVIDVQPSHARAQGLLAAACAALNRRECAQAAFDASIQSNPRDPSVYVNAGAFSLQTANSLRAAAYFASALAIDPSSNAARTGLAQAQAVLRAR